MTDLPSVEECSDFLLCSQCIHDEYFAKQVNALRNEGVCSYCGEKEPCISILDASIIIESVFDRHFQRAAMEPNFYQSMMLRDKEMSYDFEPDGEPTIFAIMNLANIPERAAHDIQRVLYEKHTDWDSQVAGEMTPFDDELHYEESQIDDASWHRQWYEFEQSLKTETRFFNRRGEELLKRIFDGLEDLKTNNGGGLIVAGGPDSKYEYLFRARAFQDEDQLKEAMIHPDRLLGPPPARVARAGRMNAHGVSVFYGATIPKVAIAEVRPPVGSRVLVGPFRIIRPLRLLNLTALKELRRSGSLFDKSFSDFLERANFLRSFTDHMSIPVMPDRETLDYLPTQAVADFLATDENLLLDGIIFPSVQSGFAGENVVLFQKASRVSTVEVPSGSEMEARTWQEYNEGFEDEFSVWIETPAIVEAHSETPRPCTEWGSSLDCSDDASFPSPPLEREISLEVILDELKVEIVKMVEFSTDSNRVTRHQMTKQDPAF